MKNKIIALYATGLGSGYVPFAPGTAGAALAIIIWTLLSLFSPVGINPWLQIALLMLLIILGVVAAGIMEKDFGKDPARVVIDEIAGIWCSILLIPFSWEAALGGFILFRIFDIWKPWPVGPMEKIPGGWGIMLDDVVAGLISNGLLRIYLQWRGLL